MSAIQLAEYWQLYNYKNELTTVGILKWSKRLPEQFPLPHAYMEASTRFPLKKPEIVELAIVAYDLKTPKRL